MMLICQPNFTIDVAPCFVSRANRSLVGILYNNGLRHSAASLLLWLELLKLIIIKICKKPITYFK
jgi:hypothetical protein